ncbi:MAG: hypothetical protein U0793_27740 [Gemmataceae bacterium]
MSRTTLRFPALPALTFAVAFLIAPAAAHAQKGGGGAVDVIRVNKCYYAVTGGGYVELLINANSSNPAARLYAYLPSGQLLGQVQNGGGGRYGGTVLGTFAVPAAITIRSSAGGIITAPCVPFQP